MENILVAGKVFKLYTVYIEKAKHKVYRCQGCIFIEKRVWWLCLYRRYTSKQRRTQSGIWRGFQLYERKRRVSVKIMKITKKQVIWISILVAAVGILVAVYYIGKSYGWFTFFESMDSIRNYVSSFGPMAPLIFFLLQFVQVIISPIPGNITTIVWGIMFGFINGFLISFAAVFLGSICAFLLGKKFGRPLVERIVGKQKIDKYMVSVSSRQKIVLFLMFLFLDSDSKFYQIKSYCL